MYFELAAGRGAGTVAGAGVTSAPLSIWGLLSYTQLRYPGSEANTSWTVQSAYLPDLNLKLGFSFFFIV